MTERLKAQLPIPAEQFKALHDQLWREQMARFCRRKIVIDQLKRDCGVR